MHLENWMKRNYVFKSHLGFLERFLIISKLPILLNLCLFGNIPNTLKVCKLHYDNKNCHLREEGGGEAVKEKWQREE